MNKLPKQVYTKEFRGNAVKLVVEERLKVPEAARRLSMSAKTLANWVHWARSGKLEEVGVEPQAGDGGRSRANPFAAGIGGSEDGARYIKKATAYFAKESLRGTR